MYMYSERTVYFYTCIICPICVYLWINHIRLTHGLSTLLGTSYMAIQSFFLSLGIDICCVCACLRYVSLPFVLLLQKHFTTWTIISLLNNILNKFGLNKTFIILSGTIYLECIVFMVVGGDVRKVHRVQRLRPRVHLRLRPRERGGPSRDGHVSPAATADRALWRLWGERGIVTNK